ncbi:hypothetical protein AB4254_20585 [Vibrio breoganii]
MTQAAPDKITFMGDEFLLCPVFSIKGEQELLSLEYLGINSTSFLSGCSRGFVASFEITTDNRLSLCSISLIGSNSISRNVCGKEVITDAYHKEIRGIDYFPQFSGKLVLLKDYLKKSSFMYNCPEDYETVIELGLEKGKVIRVNVIRVKDAKSNEILSKEFTSFTEANKFAKFLCQEGVQGVTLKPNHSSRFTVRADFDREFEYLFNEPHIKQRRCSECDEVIPFERVKVAPSCYLCIECLSTHESNNSYHRKMDVDGIGGSRDDARRTLRNRRD